MDKSIYIDLMDKVLTAYSDERIREYTERVRKNGIEEHGYPRLTINLGILIAHGRRPEYKDRFIEMMDLCCSQIPTILARNGGAVGNDFSVKELVCGIIELEKSGVFDKALTDRWRNDLAKINPYETYTRVAEVPPKPLGNWAAFGAASEQMRKFAGIGDESDFIDNQVASQLFNFDKNGMYIDPPDEPMVYDFVTRLQFAIMLHYGYNGKYLNVLEDYILKSADLTLKMQSATGEIPFGGRSNQFLHNETFYAALCEYYAVFFKKRGDLIKAGMFKRAAAIATNSIIPWLNANTIHHVKNYYPIDSMYGCESYAYFDKYMVTTGSWLSIAYAFADDSIQEVPYPSENENYISKTSDAFHRVFCKYGDYHLQFELKADKKHDGTGLGRIHKKGVPSALCLSSSFTNTPYYKIDTENKTPFSICGGIKVNGDYLHTYDDKLEYTLKDEKVDETSLVISFDCRLDKKLMYTETYTVSQDGVDITVEGNGDVEIVFPAFLFDGETKTDINTTDKSVTINYKGHTCRYTSSDIFVDKDDVCANRNGHYKKMAVQGKDKVSLKIELN